MAPHIATRFFEELAPNVRRAALEKNRDAVPLRLRSLPCLPPSA